MINIQTYIKMDSSQISFYHKPEKEKSMHKIEAMTIVTYFHIARYRNLKH